MLWFGLWTGVVVAWGVGIALGLRWLWHRASGLGHNLAATADAAQAFQAALDGVPEAPPLAPLGVGSDGAQARARLAELRATRADRTASSRRRQADIRRQWAVLAGWRAEGPEL